KRCCSTPAPATEQPARRRRRPADARNGAGRCAERWLRRRPAPLRSRWRADSRAGWQRPVPGWSRPVPGWPRALRHLLAPDHEDAVVVGVVVRPGLEDPVGVVALEPLGQRGEPRFTGAAGRADDLMRDRG